MRRLLSIRIRLRRMGSRKKPFYRIVVADARSPRDGSFIETIGHYDPLNKSDIVIDLKKVEEWGKKGAKATNTLEKLIKRVEKQQGNIKTDTGKKNKNQVVKSEKEG